MSVLVRFLGGEELHLEVESDEWEKLFKRALRERGVVEIHDPDEGEKLGINPQGVVYWKSTPEQSGKPREH